jgi:hypothetical protein
MIYSHLTEGLAMPNKVWKQAERRGAASFGTKRNSLSGGASKMTRSDTIHPRLYIEQKYAARNATWTLWDDTAEKAAKENAAPFEWELYSSRKRAGGKPQKKRPLILLHRKRSKGFLVVVHIDDLPEVAREWFRANGGFLGTLAGDPDLCGKPQIQSDQNPLKQRKKKKLVTPKRRGKQNAEKEENPIQKI